jgi:hypothetical protein
MFLDVTVYALDHQADVPGGRALIVEDLAAHGVEVARLGLDRPLDAQTPALGHRGRLSEGDRGAQQHGHDGGG